VATSRTDIYSRAINRFDDPHITSAFNKSPIEFFEIMSGYLDSAIPYFTIPNIMLSILMDNTKPSGETELFDGTGISNKVTLTTTPTIDAYFYGEINGVPYEVIHDPLTNEITFPIVIPVGVENTLVQWYDAGQFNQTLTDRQCRILSGLLLQCWSEKEMNFLLDIRRLLNDTDYKMGVEATNMMSKARWFNGIREANENEMKMYSWDVYNNELRKQYGMPQIGGV
jgi:hypothetical protein